MLSQELIFTALEAEAEGNEFSIAFDNVWESFGYSVTAGEKQAYKNTKRFFN